MSDTTIEWTDKVWNPVTGCDKVSQGCKHCYAEGVAERFWAEQYPANADGSPRKFTDVRCHEDRLDAPLHWRKPARVFVNSMSDLFHEDVPEGFIRAAFAIMAQAPQHTFQILTKRPARMCAMLGKWQHDGLTLREGHGCVLPNVWLGVSVENQATADERIPLLLQAPAVVRWISAEPLLGPIDLDSSMASGLHALGCGDGGCSCGDRGLDWVVCGGESGPHARAMHPAWARSLREQCQAARVPFFFKQWGEWKAETRPGTEVELATLQPNQAVTSGDGDTNHTLYTRVGKKAAGSLLDGREWKEYPR